MDEKVKTITLKKLYMNIAIVGAGISGLSAAHILKDKHNVTIFEKENVAGGLIKCVQREGSLFHTCGGHIFNSKRQDVLDWFWSKFQRETEFTKADRNSVVFVDKLNSSNSYAEIPYPIENHMYLFDSETQTKFIDDLVDIAAKKDNEVANFEDFLKGRFGQTLYELYFRPYNEKVWRRDLSQVPLTWLEGKLPMPTVSEMIYNNINHIKEKSFVHSTFWYEKVGGSQFIVDRLTEGLNIKYNSNIETVKFDGVHWNILGDIFDRVIFCGNIKDMIPMIEGVQLNAYLKDVESLEFHGTTAVFCEIDANPYSWIYQPSKQHESHRIICTGNFSKSNNNPLLPNGRITATVEFTDEISKDDILKNLSHIPLNPQYIDHKYNKYTYPIQDENTRNLIADMKKELSKYGFHFTGRFADWEYYNMDVAIGAAIDTCKMYGLV